MANTPQLGRSSTSRRLLLVFLLSLHARVSAFVGRPAVVRTHSFTNARSRYCVPKKAGGALKRKIGVGSQGFKKQPVRRSSLTPLFMWNWGDDDIQGSNRIKACIPYILPLLDGDQFGQYIYERINLLHCVNAWTLGPLVDLYHKIPFLGITLFCLLTLGTRFNFEGMDRNVRFNAQQAALISVALILPELIGEAFIEDPLPRWIVEPSNNLVWYASTTAVGYCIFSNLRGKKPDQLPYISSGAELMTGPF